MKDSTILKYVKNIASSSEEREVENWIMSSKENMKEFNRLKAMHIASSFEATTNTTNVDKAYTKYDKSISRHLNRRKRVFSVVLKCAAVITILLGVKLIYTKVLNTPDIERLNIEGAITLELDNGDIKIISEDGTIEVVDVKGNIIGKQQGTKLRYQSTSVSEKLVYNTLTVPYGKRFNIVLSDGTEVMLNSGTSIKYPEQFIKGKNRNVFLMGEAFFKVAKDKNHPFIVQSGDLDIRVLGTQFNVSSYPEDVITNTVLVEGEVSVYDNKIAYEPTEAVLLAPGQMVSWDKESRGIEVEEADISLYTAWTKGKIIFRHMPFKNILKKLERHYNVTITNTNTSLANELFTASFDIETIEEVFMSFDKNHNIDYTINDNQIIIN
ncbi:MAG: FecR domain-containing protein [Cellulophaga sp.]